LSQFVIWYVTAAVTFAALVEHPAAAVVTRSRKLCPDVNAVLPVTSVSWLVLMVIE
jgi:hypothetical protein